MRWSNEMFRIFGLPVESTPTFTELLPYIHPEDREKLVETDKKLCSGIGPGEVEYRIIRPDGEVRFIRATAEVIKDHRGAPTRIVGATQDITEQVEAREFLRRSEARLKSAERLTHVGNWHWDIKANRVSWSDELFKIFGQPENSTPSYEAFLEAVIPQDRDRVAGEVRDYLAKKRGYSMEFRISRPDGELRTIACIAEVGLDQEGLPAEMFGACHDITDFRRAQEENIAHQKLETIGTLTNGIAHDFNNILGGVLAQAELALDELGAGSLPEEELRAIRGGAIRGSEIVRELMIYAGKDNGVLGPVDISHTVEEMIQLLNVSVSKHATLKTDLGRDLPDVRATVAQVSQIILNLVTNASEAIDGDQGFITVKTERVLLGPGSRANPSLPDGDYIRLKVSDTGCGMGAGIRSKIFDPFFTTKSVGRGLGLAVVHGIARRLGGAIDVASEPGKGTTFEILLPCETTVGNGHGAKSGPEDPAGPSRVVTILFVEDEDAIRSAASKILRNAGLVVIEAGDGSTALDAIRALENPIDVLFLDVTIPGAPSREVLAEAVYLRPEMKVIVTSAHSEDKAADLLKATFRHFIRKPYRLGDLADLIRQTLL